jgi:hypothetical protein
MSLCERPVLAGRTSSARLCRRRRPSLPPPQPAMSLSFAFLELPRELQLMVLTHCTYASLKHFAVRAAPAHRPDLHPC